MFVFSLLAPFVLPIINQVKTELNTGSSEIIQSSKEKQLVVFYDDNSSNPTHSMLSKDHFSNILNEPAGKIASQVLKWVVPQLISCWDDERIDVERTLNRIIQGVFHHPNLRDFGNDGAVDGRRLMFSVVQQWWGSKDEQERRILRDQLSRDGVEKGRNHKEGVHDTGHGCGKPLGMPTTKTANSSGALGGLAGGAILGQIGSALAGESRYDAGYSRSTQSGGGGGGGGTSGIGKFAEAAVGGGAVGGIVGGLAGAIGGDLLGEAFGGSKSEKKTYQSQKFEEDGSYTQSVTETGYRPQYGGNQPAYGQAEYSQTRFSGGGQRQEYQRYEQDDQYGRTGYGERITQESRPTYGGGYERTTEKRYEQPGGVWESEVVREERDSRGRMFRESNEYEGRGGFSRVSESENYRQETTESFGGQRRGSDEDNHRTRDHRGDNRFQEQRSEYTSGGYDRPAFGGQDYGGRQEEFERREEYPGREEFSERQEYGRVSGGGRFEREEEFERQDYGRGSGGGRFGREEEPEQTETFGEERSYDQGDRGYGQVEDEHQERRQYGDEDRDDRY
jgi:hypothetical protein